MRDINILFSTPMVLAQLAGTKTMTRRVVKPQPDAAHDGEPYWFIGGYHAWGHRPEPSFPLRVGGNPLPCPYGQPGDILLTRETFFAWGKWEKRYSAKKGRDEWHFIDMTVESGNSYLYAADGVKDTQAFIKRRSDPKPMYWKRPAIFMPKAAVRIRRRITSVRVERLCDISDADALAEGVDRTNTSIPGYAKARFKALWVSINGQESWDASPWVWVISFEE